MVLAYIKFIKRGIICILGLVTYTFCAAFFAEYDYTIRKYHIRQYMYNNLEKVCR